VKILSPKNHGYLDYVVVVGFLLAPQLLGLSGIPATIAYLLAPIHLLVTLLTDFPLGVFKAMSLRLHGYIEFIVSFTLIALPWLLGFASVTIARNFYVASGVVIFLVWLITDYKATRSIAETSN
jgi:hypothetical protein